MIWLVPIVPAAGALLVGIARFAGRRTLAAVSCGVLAVTLVLAALGATSEWTGTVAWSDMLSLTAGFVPASAVMAVLVPAIALPVLLYAASHEEPGGLARLTALLLAFVGGMELLVIASDFLTLLIGWEIVGACSWALIGHDWKDAGNPAGGRYAFVTTRFGDLGLFAAAMAAFAGSGSFAFEDISGVSDPWLSILAFGVLLSAAAKAGQVPFSPWLFRAMAGPTSVSALLHAATMVAAGAFLLIRLHPELQDVAGFSATTLTIGLMTAIAGGIAAVLQAHAKKLLAASTSAQYGLMFVAVGAGYPAAALLHLVAHSAFKALLFLAAGSAGERGRSFALARLGFGLSMPLIAVSSTIGALALAGIPPTGGGWSKEMVTAAAEHASLWAGLGVMFAGALSAAYAARLQLLAFGTSGSPAGSGTPSIGETVAVTALAALVLATSIAWLPGFRSDMSALLGMELPEAKPIGIAASLTLLAIGLLAGIALARQWPTLGTSGGTMRAAEWLGLPATLNLLVVLPLERLSTAAARFDDTILDAGPQLIAKGGSAFSQVLSRADRRAVDRGVTATADATAWFARVGGRVGEMLSNGIPLGSARLVAIGGTDARRLQTGLSHHYYALMAGGALITILILAMA